MGYVLIGDRESSVAVDTALFGIVKALARFGWRNVRAMSYGIAGKRCRAESRSVARFWQVGRCLRALK
jgi:hypothetical protein